MTGRNGAPERFTCLRRASIGVVTLPMALAAQAPVTPMTPSPPHEALTFFEGSWTTEERPASQGFVETCAWLPSGRRHMVCRSTWTAVSGAREGWSIFSYSATDSTYLYYGLRAGGTVEPMRGRRLADGWEFLSEVGAGPTRERVRVTITQLATHRFRLVASAAVGDGPWAVVDTEHYIPAPRPR
jgi:hypothetical protein